MIRIGRGAGRAARGSTRAARGAGLLLAVVAGAPAAAQVATLAPATAAPRLEGAYGLNVMLEQDSVVVRWLTARAEAGRLEVWVDGKAGPSITTGADTAHRYAFTPPREREFSLRFGADTAELHEVIIDTDGRRRRRTTWSGTDSIYVISDIHGEFDRMTAVLRNAGLIDEDLHWAGGRKHLVVIGDVFDRGPDATRALWFLYGLEREAGQRDGPVHIMLGNHEIMVMLDDLRYVSDKENEVARLYGTGYSALFDPRTSVIGRWLTSRPAVIRIGDVLFAHGGVSSDYVDWKLEQVEDSLAAFTHEELFARWNDTTFLVPLDSAGWLRRWNFFWNPRSIFWYRGYVASDTTEAELDAVLKAYRSRVMVVGHTPGPTIRNRFGGKLIAVNTLPFAAEVLLMVRRRGEWDRFRIGETGPPIPMEPADPLAGPGLEGGPRSAGPDPPRPFRR